MSQDSHFCGLVVRSLACVAGLGMGACGSQTAPEGGPAPTAQPTTVVPQSMPGYAHSLARSRFKIGQGPSLEVNTPTLQRWRGTLGSIAFDPTNSWSMAILNADAPAGPYILDETTHNDRVKAYFLAAGIPLDQIGSVQTTYQAHVTGTRGANSGPQLDSITSILRRVVHGIPVPESVAWAKMTTDGNVDAECVFWPPIDSSTLQNAVNLAAKVADQGGHAALVARLPPIVREIGVVIHHTDPSMHSTPTAYAAFDAVVGSVQVEAPRHFDSNGTEFRLPHELSGEVQASVRQ